MSLTHTYKICEDEFTETLTKAKAIRKHCLDCSSGFQGEVAKCRCIKCALFPFRFGNEKGLSRVDHLKEGYVDPDDFENDPEGEEQEEAIEQGEEAIEPEEEKFEKEEDTDPEIKKEPEMKSKKRVKRKKVRRSLANYK